MTPLLKKMLRVPYEWVMTPVWRRAAVRAYRARQDEVRRADGFDEAFYLRTYPDIATRVGDRWGTAFEHYFAYGRDEGRLPNESAQDALLEVGYSPWTVEAFVEFTSRCNLRCVYCAVSQPDYAGTDLSLSSVEALIEALRSRGTKRVCVNGHGETTILKDWVAQVGAIVDAGFEVHMIGNLAKRYSEAEVGLLARYHSIQVSLDTIDAALLGELRRGARLHAILDNMSRIREAAAPGNGPQMSISCVVTDQNVDGIPDLVASMMENGIREFRFCDLVKYPDVSGALAVRHVSTMDPERVRRAREAFKTAMMHLEEKGGWFWIEPSLEPILAGDDTSMRPASSAAVSAVGSKESFHSEIPEGMTRDCLDPWSFLYLHATGDIRPCCMLEETYATFGKGSLEENLNNEKFRELRKRLITGRLDEACGTCRARPVVTTAELQKKVKENSATRRPVE